MSEGGFGPIPFILDFQNLPPFDLILIFVISALLTIMIHAEAQAWVATLLGDVRPDATDRLHFNVLFHLSFPGSLCYVLAGFGWPKPIDIDPAKFRFPRLYSVIVRFSGAVANILLANIAASIIFVFRFLDMDPRVFLMLAGVSVTTAVYNLIPLPPLAAGSLITVWLPWRSPLAKRIVYYCGSSLVVALFLVERATGRGLLSPYLNPLVWKILGFMVGYTP